MANENRCSMIIENGVISTIFNGDSSMGMSVCSYDPSDQCANENLDRTYRSYRRKMNFLPGRGDVTLAI